MLQSTVTFGSKQEADDAADRINKLHLRVNGVDEVTGERYDACAHDLLLWVHAALEVSSLWFFDRTVRPLSRAERQRYHEENMVSAELLWLPSDQIPATIEEMEAYVNGVVGSGRLVRTDVSDDVADIIRSGPVPRGVKWMWGFIAFASFGTLPDELKQLYGVTWGPWRQRWLNVNLALLRRVRPFLPRRFRLIGPAQWAYRKLEGKTDLPLAEAMKRAAAGRRS